MKETRFGHLHGTEALERRNASCWMDPSLAASISSILRQVESFISIISVSKGYHITNNLSGWWLTYPSEKIRVRQLRLWHSQCMESHNPAMFQSPPTRSPSYSHCCWFIAYINHYSYLLISLFSKPPTLRSATPLEIKGENQVTGFLASKASSLHASSSGEQQVNSRWTTHLIWLSQLQRGLSPFISCVWMEMDGHTYSKLPASMRLICFNNPWESKQVQEMHVLFCPGMWIFDSKTETHPL